MVSLRFVGTVAIALLLPALALAEDFSQQGQQALKKEDYERAIACLSKAIEANPKDAASYRGRGDAYLQKDKFDQALADLNEAIRLNPKDAMALQSRSRLFLMMGRNRESVADASASIRLDPKCRRLWEPRACLRPAGRIPARHRRLHGVDPPSSDGPQV